MKPHEQRVVDEKQALDEKIEKLTAFTKTDLCMALPFHERTLLHKQLQIMKDYSIVLDQRISLFTEN